MNLPNYKEARKREKNYKRISYILDKKYIGKYSEKKYFLKTYGCQMNEHDSENIKALLEKMGFIEIEEYEHADLILLNTCSIRENAHNKAFGMLGRLKHLKEKRKDLIVGLCGCMAQEEGVIDQIMKKYKFVNFVFGTHNINHLPEIVDKAIIKNKQEIEVFSKEGDLIENMPVRRANSYKAYVNIIYGCDKFCTYCIVPFTRGGERSRRKEDILKEIDSLVKDGYQEVTLLGQPRIRFVTSHPWDFTDKMIDIIAKYDNIMPSIHLPLQSGSSKILKLMGRRYTKESYLELFNKMKEKIPNVAISTDIIVGFPGETEEDFLETLEVVEHCKYDNAFTFIYSKRENTAAAKLKDEISQSEKENRLQRLNNIVNKYFLEKNKKLVGCTVEVLTEGKSPKKENLYYGYTKTNKLVNFDGQNIKEGELVSVKITDAKTWSLDGKVFK